MSAMFGTRTASRLARASLAWAGMGVAGLSAFGQDPQPGQVMDSYYQEGAYSSNQVVPVGLWSRFSDVVGPDCYNGCSAPDEEEAWQLTNLFDDACGCNWMTCNNIRLGGNIAQSFAFNGSHPNDHFNGPVTWTDRANEYQLNQLWLTAEKTTDTSQQDWDFGGRVDVLYGTNARFTTSTGLEVGNVNSGNSFYGIAIPQFYAEAAYKKLKVKVGHFISPVGYFTVDTTQNFFNTIPYTYQYGEPFTHTGALATYPLMDDFTILSGIIRGWDNFDSSNPHLGYVGGWTKTWADTSSLAHVLFFSQEPNFGGAFTNRYFQSLVYSRPLTCKLNYVAQSDFGYQDNATFAGKQALWYGLNQYMFYQINSKLNWGINFEWFRDEDGYRVGGFLPGAAPSGITGTQRGLSPARTGYSGNFYQVTFGPKYQVNKNMFLRLNTRLDWYQGSINSITNPGLLKPYDDGTGNHQALLIGDVVVTF